MQNNKTSRRQFLKLIGYSSAGLGFATSLEAVSGLQSTTAATPFKIFSTAQQTITVDHGNVVRVGILHSLSGTMAIVEKSVVEAEILAIAEINRKGGVLGKQIKPVIEDCESDWVTFREKATKLIEKDQVATVFGCWTSASRKSVLPMFERSNHMLWYPMTYEGQECSKNIFYTGAVPNQQIEPTVSWFLSRFANQPIFLVGSDYVFSRVVNTVIKGQLSNQTRNVLGEGYIPLGDTDIQLLVREIKNKMPQGGVIFSSLVGDTNVAFFQQLKVLGMHPQQYPVVSFSIAEEEIAAIGAEYLQGHYAAWSYFQTVNTEANTKFIQSFKRIYGRDRLVTDVMQSAYTAVYLWKQAVEKAGTATDLERVRAAAIGQSFNAPEGKVLLTPTHHLAKHARIGQIRRDGLCTIVYATREPITPQPWNEFIETKGNACNWS